MDQKEYGNILESLQNIRAGVMASCQQELMFTGMMPPAAQAELKVVGDITGAVFHGLSNLGFSVAEDPTNLAMVVVTINGRSYNCLRMQMEGVKISPAAPVVQQTVVSAQQAVAQSSAPVRQVVAAQTQAAPIEQIKEPEVKEEIPEEAAPATEAKASTPVIESSYAAPRKGSSSAASLGEDSRRAASLEKDSCVAAPRKESSSAASFEKEQSPVAENIVSAGKAAAIWDDDEEEEGSSSAASLEDDSSAAAPVEEKNSLAEEKISSEAAPAEVEGKSIVFEESSSAASFEEEPAPAKINAAAIWDDDDEEEEEGSSEDAFKNESAEKKVMSLTDAINQGFDPMAEEKESSVLPETFEAPVAGDIEAVKEAPVSGGAKILGGGGAKVLGGGSISTGSAREEFFLDETEKLATEFVYSYSRISVSHSSMGGGGRPEEMLIMIAPLKIHKNEQTSVPIVVAIVHNGKYKMASSYDILEDGKNIVTIDIDEFYFLCRGSFSEDGRFVAKVVTTGPSAQQGDKIRPISSVSHGDGKAAG
ncbi:MAG: hypothetical protein IKN07_08915, partial [Lachnospiraceae bacterium]|nr:hypothetical protein [Lachnospiraceae bacterium]